MKLSPLASPAQAAQLDAYMMKEMEIPGLLLMEQAAAALAAAAERLCPPGSRVLCVAGSGGNGGDAWAVGRILLGRGWDVRMGAVTLTPSSADAAQNVRPWARLSRRVTLLEDEAAIRGFFAQPADLIIDGLLGTGLSRPAQGRFREIILAMNAHPARVLSIDIPSGIAGETGAGETAVQAACTVTFQRAKPGHYLFPGRARSGRLTVAPIGIDEGAPPADLWVLSSLDLPARDAAANKGSFGRLAIAAGSASMAGAAALAARGALAGGAGLTTALCCPFVQRMLQAGVSPVTARVIGTRENFIDQLPVSALAGFDALAVGPGLGLHEELWPSLAEILSGDLPKVADADALNLLAAHREDGPRLGANTVLTPHPKEFSRLTGMPLPDILADPVAAARGFAAAQGATVLLKGATTVVADGERACLIPFGAPSMAKGGSGDVLTGVIGALLAQGFAPFEAAVTGAGLCGMAGQLAAAGKGDYAPTAEDTIAWIGRASRL